MGSAVASRTRLDGSGMMIVSTPSPPGLPAKPPPGPPARLKEPESL
jgi:hypothetical protein